MKLMLKVFLYLVFWTGKYFKFFVVYCSKNCFFRMIKGRIDQVNHVLVLESCQEDFARYQAIEKWANTLSILQQLISLKI